MNVPADDGRDGWWQGARACPSPNFGDRPAGTAIDLVVLHSLLADRHAFVG